MTRSALAVASIVLMVLCCGTVAVAQVAHYPVNDDGTHEIGIQGRLDNTAGSTCDPPLGVLGAGSIQDALVGDETLGGDFTRGENVYAILSFDTSGWSCAGRFTLRLTEAGIWGDPFGDLGGAMLVEYRTSTRALPSRQLNPDEVEGPDYGLVGAFTESGLFEAAGIDITSIVRGVVCGPHDPYLYLRFRLPICTDGDGEPDAVSIAARVGVEGRARIDERLPTVPTLGWWGIALTTVLLAGMGAWMIRRRLDADRPA